MRDTAITCNVLAGNSIICIPSGVCGGGWGYLDIRRFSCHQYRELDRADRVTGRRRFGEKVLFRYDNAL